MEEYYVQVRKIEDNGFVVVEELGPHAENKAERIDRGININLNHDDYYTMVGTKADFNAENI